MQKSMYYYKIASKTILEEKFIQPFIDNYLIFGNYVYECIKDEGKDFVDKIESICQTFLNNSLQTMFCMKGVVTEPLNNKETRIAMLILKDLKNKEIAQRLNVSPKTVKTSIAIIYEKLLVQNRAELKRMIFSSDFDFALYS